MKDMRTRFAQFQSQPSERDSPAWVKDRTDGMLGMLEHQFGHKDIRVEHAREAELLRHEFWFCTVAYVENGAPLGFNRLTVQHPPGCTCDTLP